MHSSTDPSPLVSMGAPQRLNVSAAHELARLRLSPLHRRGGRDPRAAPPATRKNVSVVETCRFYGVADALTTCRVPRSCQDCLDMPNCVLSLDGRCNDAADWVHHGAHAYPFGDRAHDAPVATPLISNDPAAMFMSANTTYCQPSDRVCSTCRETFTGLARSSATRDALQHQYCVGTDGCVCLGVCELPALLAASAYDSDCGMDAPSVVITRGYNVSTATSVHRDPRAPLAQLQKRKQPDTCEFHGAQDLRGCRVPRSCRECLETEGCMIRDHKCVSMDAYDPLLDFRNGTRPASSYVLQFAWNGSAVVPTDPQRCSPQIQFPSVNTTYCSPSDAVCAECRVGFAANAAQYEAIGRAPQCYATNTTFCIGTGGCVCIEQCEDTAFFFESTRDDACRSPRTYDGVRVGEILAGVLSVLFVALCFAVRGLIRSRPVGGYRQAAGLLMRNMIDQAPALNLDLFGWRHFQRQLLEKEEALLSGADNVSPVSRPVDFNFAAATAPDFEEDDSSAPTATDPHALASAPVFRLQRREDSAHSRWGLEQGEDPSIPSAPDLTTL